mmetsp:Transcript_43248/g.72003  ORF Transcript_43248/g.72003 Transcript_43248/m.72003 type:complete len:294 (+) Transcript_43248:440-1321(+)
MMMLRRMMKRRFLQDDALSLLAAFSFLAACGRSFRLDDASHEAEKHLLDVLVCLSARLEEGALVLCRQLLSTQRVNLSMVLHVGLVSHQEEGNAFTIGDAEDLLKEVLELLKAFGHGDRVDAHKALTSAVVVVAHGGVVLLAGCVEDIDVGVLAVERDGLAITVGRRGIVLFDEIAVHEHQRQRRLSDSSCAHDDDLVQRRVLLLLAHFSFLVFLLVLCLLSSAEGCLGWLLLLLFLLCQKKKGVGLVLGILVEDGLSFVGVEAGGAFVGFFFFSVSSFSVSFGFGELQPLTS